MKRSNRFLIALLATGLTFGSLYALTGPPPGFSHRGRHAGWDNCEGHRYEKQEGRYGQNRQQAPADRLPTDEQ